MMKLLLVGTALSFLFVSNAMAQSRSGACAPDIKKACADITPGNGRIAACVKEHLTELSDPCKARLAEIVAAAKTCREDVQKQCGDVRQRVEKVACIKDALTNLGDECKAAAGAAVTNKK